MVLVTDIYASGEDPIEGVSIERLVEEINKVSPVIYTPGLAEVTRTLQKETRAGDIVVALGAGNVGRWIRRVSRWDKLGEKWPSQAT